MLTVRLPGLSAAQTVVPAVEIRLADGCLHVDGNQHARYQGGNWIFGDFHAVTLPIDSQVKVRFESSDGRSVMRGPFDQLAIVDGSLRYGEHGRELLATLNHASAKWRLSDGSEWDTVTIRRPHRFE
jgi:hypothetical protein